MLTDPLSRTVGCLRISVTDRCDLRYTYRLPRGFKGFAVLKDQLTIEETARVAATFARLGTRRFRFAGGEPPLCKGLTELTIEISRQPGVGDISLTTNGTCLGQQVRALHAVGARRLNISLDSLHRDCAASITDSDCLPQVLEGITTAKEADFKRIKISMVPLKGINDTDLGDTVAFCIQHGFILNLIEAVLMGAIDQMHVKVNLQSVLEDLCWEFGLTLFGDHVGDGPTCYWHNGNNGFTPGLITPMSQCLYATCNHVRLLAIDNIHLCLEQEDKVPLRNPLRGSHTDAELDQEIHDTIALRPEKHEFAESSRKITHVMTLASG